MELIRQAPGPTPRQRKWLRIKNILTRRGSRQRFDDLVAKYGNFVRLNETNYLARSPEIVRDIFLNRETFIRDFQRGYGESATQFWGNSYSLFNGDTWLNKRHIIHKMVQPDRVNAYINQSVLQAQSVIASWDISSVTELHPLLMRLTLVTTTTNLFGWRLDDAQLDVIEEALYATFLWFDNLILKVLDEQSDEERYFIECVTKMDALIYQLIDQHRANPPTTPNMLHVLMNEPDSLGNILADKELRDEIATILRAGHRNDGTLLTWCIALLGLNPAKKEKLQHEISQHIGIEIPATHHLPHLTYTKQVLSEAMRLYPLYEVIARTTTTPTILLTYDLPQKAVIIVDIWGIQHHEAYFDKPNEFMPERWTEELATEVERTYVYAPFGAGARRCPYQALALGETMLLLTYLMQQFDFELPKGYRLKKHSSQNGLFPKDGVPVKLHRKMVSE